MRLIGLMMFAALTAVICGAGQALAAPGTTTTPGATASPGAGAAPGATAPSAPSTSDKPAGPKTGVSPIDDILDQLAKAGSSSPQGDIKNEDETSQMVVVTAPKSGETAGKLTTFERSADKSWKQVAGPVKADLGSQGMGKAKDDVPVTPEGTFALDQAFGRQANPGTKMPYFKTTKQDWWDENTKSPTYNTHVHSAKSPGGDSENLYNAGPAYDYAVDIAHNPQRIPGKASAMFLHVSTGVPTDGCVSIPKASMAKVLRWLDPAKHPKITIGVNKSAPTSTSPEGSPRQGSPKSDDPSTSSPESGAPEQRSPGQSSPDQGSPGQGSPGQGSPKTGPQTSAPNAPSGNTQTGIAGLDNLLGGTQLSELLAQLTDLLPSLAR